MARQNVGNPKFYIDYLSYWKARANILEYNNTNGHTNELNKLIKHKAVFIQILHILIF